MAFTYNLALPIGQVRLLIPDRVDVGHVFEDDELTAFLALEGNRVKCAAAAALEMAASDNAMVLKVMRLLDLTTDGAKVSDALRARAQALREQDAVEDVVGAFGYAEQVFNSFGERERLWKQAERGA